MNEIDEKLKGMKIRDGLTNINPQVFDWLKDILKMNVSRTLEISTFFLNLTIAQNYFPWANAITKEFPDIVPKILDSNKIRSHR